MSIREHVKRDDGLTLVELMVSMLILVIVMGMASSIFIAIITNERYARATAEANNSAQLVMKQFEYDVRNARWVVVDQAGSLLVAATRTAPSSGASSDVGVCVAYFFDASSGQVRRSSVSSSAEALAALGATNTAAVRVVAQDWTVVAEGVSALGSSAFGPQDNSYTESMTVDAHMSFETMQGRSPVEVEKSVTIRPQGDLTVSCR